MIQIYALFSATDSHQQQSLSKKGYTSGFYHPLFDITGFLAEVDSYLEQLPSICFERQRIAFVVNLLQSLFRRAVQLKLHYINEFVCLQDEVYASVTGEVKSAIGRADMVVKMQDAVYVFEFKVDGTPEEALEQINSKGYAIPYQSGHRKVIKIGVNFDSAIRTIGDWKIVEEV